MITTGLQARATLLSLLLAALLLGIWQLATLPKGATAAVTLTAEQVEYAKLLGKDPVALAGGLGIWLGHIGGHSAGFCDWHEPIAAPGT